MYRIESLDLGHAREGFNCGSEPLNLFLQQTARQHAQRGLSRTFVLVDEAAVAPKAILGFFSLNICEIRADTLPAPDNRKLPRTASGVRLGRLAVAQAWQRKGLGSILLSHAMQLVMDVFELAGGIGLFVDAKDEHAKAFYEQFGFVPLPDNELQLFLPTKSIRAALGKESP